MINHVFRPCRPAVGGTIMIDTLLAALRVFRKGLVDEVEEYDRRERELDTSPE